MLRHYFKLVRSGLIKNKFYTAINIIGLTCGMLSSLIIAKYVGYTFELDNFHLFKNRIFSVNEKEFINGKLQQNEGVTYWGVGEQIRQFPEVAAMTRYRQHMEVLVTAQSEGAKQSFIENKVFIADSNFLRVFTFPFIYGESKTALSRINTVVLTKSACQKYFGNHNPIGQTLTIALPWGKNTTYEVTGVMEDIPDLSKFKFDFLITPTDLLDVENPWRAPECTTYVLLNENTRGDVLANKLTRALGEIQQLHSTNRKLVASLTPITEARLSTTEYLIGTVGILIMFICWINYINQITAQSYWRMKETGILRVMGANKLNLIWQFVIESTLTCSFSLVAIIITYLSLERFLMSRLSNHLLPLFGDHTYINFIFAMIFVGGIITAAALSTAILFSRDFGKVLQNVNRTRIGGINIRRALVVLQFSVSSILVICIFVIQNQLEFLERADKGINMQDILVVNAPIVNEDTTWNLTRTKLKLFKAKCLELPFVSEVSSSTTVPSDQYRNETYLSLQNENDKFLVHQSGVDTGFFRLYNAEFIAGHAFAPHASFKNSRSIILNESAARGLGIYDFEQAIDTHIIDHESNKVYGVIGIIKDFHQTPLKYKLEPMAFKFNVARGDISMKIVQAGTTANNIDFKIKEINKAWKQVYGDTFFDYFFPGEKYEAQNLEDRYFGAIFGCLAFLSLTISCLGVFGMSLLISIKRQKEIGIRKVFGASTSEITFIFLREYLGPLTISIAIGTPIGHYLMTIWLRTYADRIAIGPGLISMAVVSLIIVFLFTISFHTVKAAMTNPVSILRE